MKSGVFLISMALLWPATAFCADVPQSVQVTTASIVKTSLSRTVLAYGVVDAGPDRLAAISLPYAGQVTALTATPGKHVKRGSLLLEFRPDPAVILAFRQSQTALTLAQGEVTRTRQLIHEHLATNSQLATAQKALEDAQSAVRTQAEAGGGQVEVTVRAPFDGTVASINATPGDRVAAGTTMLDMAAGNGNMIGLGLEPGESRLVKPGQSVTLTVLEEPLTLKGVIDNVGVAIEPKTGLVIATLHPMPNPGTAVLPGEHVSGSIEIDRKESWAVPRGAVLSDANGAFLFQVINGKAKRVAVSTGIESAGLIGIDGPVNPSLPVIVKGSYEAADGMSVRIAIPPFQKQR